MDLKQLEKAITKPPLYERGDSVMWTDPHISKQLLELHLDPDTELASRTRENIGNTLEFILDQCDGSSLDILDLGCGPGLYAERLAEAGHHVTGVDFSENSIEYAKNQAKIKHLPVDYVCRDYLTIDFHDSFDLVLLIYTDFGVLLPQERKKLLDNIHRALRTDGILIFDVINDKDLKNKFQESRKWSFEKRGFWSGSPYLELSDGIHYPEDKVFLQQHIIIDRAEKISTYRFWTHYFAHTDILDILSENGFADITGFDDVLTATNVWGGDNITFYKARKIR